MSSESQVGSAHSNSKMHILDSVGLAVMHDFPAALRKLWCVLELFSLESEGQLPAVDVAFVRTIVNTVISIQTTFLNSLVL